MKQLQFIFILLVALTLSNVQNSVLAQTTKAEKKMTKAEKKKARYLKEMKASIAIMDKAMNPPELHKAATEFERIGQENGKEWLPPYYTSYCYVVMSLIDRIPEQKDVELDHAQDFLNKARELSKDNAEIEVLQAYLYQMRLEIDPNNRMEEFGTLMKLALEDATALDKNNPRLYYLKAQNMFFSTDQVNGGLNNACPLLKTALEKYANNKPATEIDPKWGEAMTNYMATVCTDLN